MTPKKMNAPVQHVSHDTGDGQVYKSPSLAVDGVLIFEGKVLLVKRKRDPFAGKWALPGGFVEYWETTENAVARELLEETALRAKAVALIGVYSAPNRDPRKHVISVAYLLSDYKGVPKGSDDAKEARWWPLDGLPKLAFDHAKILRDGLQILREERRK